MLRVFKKYNQIFLTGIYCFCIIPFLGVTDLQNIWSGFYPIWLSVAMLMLCGRLLYRILTTGMQFDKFYYIFLLYQALVCTVSIYYNRLSPGMLVVAITTSVLVLLMQVDEKMILDGLIVSIISLSIINFFSVCLNFRATDTFFIGGKNQLSMFLIPSMFFMIVYSMNKNNHINVWTIAFILICLLSIALGGSGTGLIVCGIAVLSLIFSKLFKFKKIILFAIIGLNIFLVFLSDLWIDSQIWLKITDFLGKSNSLTGRTDVWGLFLEQIEQHFLFGRGKGAIVFYIDQWGDKRIFSEAHNVFLEIFSVSGVLGFIVYVFFFGEAVLGLNCSDKRQKYVFIAIFVMLINGLTESINNNIMFTIMIALAYCYSCEDNNRNRKLCCLGE